MPANPDLLIYLAHLGYWSSFGVAHLLSRRNTVSPADDEPAAEQTTASYSRTLVFVHAVAFGVMYFGIGAAVFPRRVPHWFAGQRLVGLIVIASGAALIAWARVWFRSWRFRAKLDAGHQLATGGPFRLMRHPIYMALNLLAIGTAIWIPTTIVWLAVPLMFIGGDLRGRAEENVLRAAFGTRYADYCARTKRFLPGVY